MDVNIEDKGTIVNVTVAGRLDTVNAASFEQTIAALYDKKDTEINIDCSQMTYISSSGLRCFIALLKSTQKNKSKIILKDIRPEIKEVFDMTGFSNLFTII